jgi:hypothetical protein
MTPAALTEIFRGFPQSLGLNAGINLDYVTTASFQILSNLLLISHLTLLLDIWSYMENNPQIILQSVFRAHMQSISGSIEVSFRRMLSF